MRPDGSVASVRFSRAPFLVAVALGVTPGACTGSHITDFRRQGMSEPVTFAVLPLENLSSQPHAGRFLAHALTAELIAVRVIVADPSVTEGALDRMGEVPEGTIGRDVAQNVGRDLGVQAVIFGSIAEVEESETGAAATVGLTIRVVDIATGQVLYGASSSVRSNNRGGFEGAARRAAREIAGRISAEHSVAGTPAPTAAPPKDRTR